ncbi:hypothetical protein GGR51DRAFT_542967 [Nemania sp. FL0031]|nr:hypothetical protein GGR51DRAFT_542967 [Nemania sp. FL0031]
MDESLESTPPANGGDASSSTPKKRLTGNHTRHLLAFVGWWSNNLPTFNTLAFLVGSIAFIILSEVVRAKRKPLIQTFSDDLNPSCTDFGNSAAEQRFAIDLAFGNFTFTQAKIIDATWDTVVGQGGRLLHGWILYCCIIYPLLVLAMEISTVTYPYYVTLSFSKASFETLIQALRMLPMTKSYSVLLCSVLLIYTLVYTLFFPLIWGTSTGYLSLSHKLYAMPGGDVIPLNSENLSLCWVLDPNKLGIPTRHVEIGPNFSTILSNHRVLSHNRNDVCLNISSPGWPAWSKYNMRYDAGGWRFESEGSSIWDFLVGGMEQSSENFMNIQSYALTRQFLQIGLNASGWVDSRTETTLNDTLVNDNGPVTLNWFGVGDYNKSQCNNISQYGLHPTLRAVTLQTQGRRDISNVVNIPPYNESTLREDYYWSPFSLDRSVHLGPGIIPYNSTIRLNQSLFHLDAPFLDIGFNCSKSSTFSSLGNCVCYDRQPISPDLLSNDRAICNTAPGYVWGFSSYLTRVGLILEAVWMTCCFVAYPWLLYRGKLLRTEPVKSAKVMRLLLDCSESIHNDIGPDVQYLREEEILKKLKNLKIGYYMDETEGRRRCRVAAGLKVNGFSERLSEADEALYKVTFPIETKISKGAQRIETFVDKTAPVANRMVNHPIHSAMNEWLGSRIAAWRSYSFSGKRKPTVNEVYEDTNWRF